MHTKIVLPSELHFRDGQLSDFNDIIRIVNSKNNRASFGFVPRVVFADAVSKQAAEGRSSQHYVRVVEHVPSGRVVAWCRAYHRQDGVTSLHELGVAEEYQSCKIGTALLGELCRISAARKMSKVRLKTVIGLRSNAYYPRFGFVLVGTAAGRKRALNVYERAITANDFEKLKDEIRKGEKI